MQLFQGTVSQLFMLLMVTVVSDSLDHENWSEFVGDKILIVQTKHAEETS